MNKILIFFIAVPSIVAGCSKPKSVAHISMRGTEYECPEGKTCTLTYPKNVAVPSFNDIREWELKPCSTEYFPVGQNAILNDGRSVCVEDVTKDFTDVAGHVFHGHSVTAPESRIVVLAALPHHRSQAPHAR